MNRESSERKDKGPRAGVPADPACPQNWGSRLRMEGEAAPRTVSLTPMEGLSSGWWPVFNVLRVRLRTLPSVCPSCLRPLAKQDLPGWRSPEGTPRSPTVLSSHLRAHGLPLQL